MHWLNSDIYDIEVEVILVRELPNLVSELESASENVIGSKKIY